MWILNRSPAAVKGATGLTERLVRAAAGWLRGWDDRRMPKAGCGRGQSLLPRSSQNVARGARSRRVVELFPLNFCFFSCFSLNFAGKIGFSFMELELFPLDVQDLSIVVRSKDPGWRMKPLVASGAREGS